MNASKEAEPGSGKGEKYNESGEDVSSYTEAKAEVESIR